MDPKELYDPLPSTANLFAILILPPARLVKTSRHIFVAVKKT